MPTFLGTPSAVVDRPLKNLGYSQITDISTVKGLDDGDLGDIPDGATLATIQVLTKNARYRDKGIDPTTTVGTQIAAGASIPYSGQLSLFKIIEESATAEVNVHFYGPG